MSSFRAIRLAKRAEEGGEIMRRRTIFTLATIVVVVLVTITDIHVEPVTLTPDKI
jgi:hypothetical protein